MPDDPSLDRLVDVLREPPPVRPEWRASLDTALARERVGRQPIERAPAWPAPRWSVRPVHAIAAAIAFMVIGAAGATLVLARRGAETRLAAAPAPATATTQDRAPVTVRFLLVAPSAHRVSVVGDFNGWDPAATPMRRSAAADDRWIVQIPVQPGRHVYAFYVDGDILSDPTAPRAHEEDFGVPQSLLLVGGTP